MTVKLAAWYSSSGENSHSGSVFSTLFPVTFTQKFTADSAKALRVRRLVDHSLIKCRADARLPGNVNGPSLIRVPDWVQNPLGCYYLYFAHHEGDRIRLAFADTLTGPWALHSPGVLHLETSAFPTVPPREEDLDPRVKAWVSQGLDGLYPHITSPDALIDEQNQQIRLYCRGRNPDGTQRTRVALSSDCLNFSALKPERTWKGPTCPSFLPGGGRSCTR